MTGIVRIDYLSAALKFIHSESFGEKNIVHDGDWQTPAITEKHAADWVRARWVVCDGIAYLGFPWATLFDLLNKSPLRVEGLLAKLESLAGEAHKSGASAVATVRRETALRGQALISRPLKTTHPIYS